MSISGNLRTMPFADLLQWVAQSRKTGTLTVDGPEFNKKIYFQEGLIAASASDNPKEYLSYYLVGWQYIGEEELRELMEMQERHGTMLGELLVIVGRLSREELTQLLQIKIEETLYELFLWEEGDFQFLEGIMPPQKFEYMNLPVDMVTLEGVRRMDEWSQIRTVIPSAAWLPRLVRAVDVQQMGESELAILREINGTNSIEQIALSCRLAPYHVMEYLYQGIVGELFAVEAPPEDAEEAAIPGFSQGAWKAMLKDIEKQLAAGELLEAHQQLQKMREKFDSQPDACEQITEVEKKIADALSEIGLSGATVLELAIPMAQLTTISCSPEEGFLLSRVNGMYTVDQITQVVPGDDLDIHLTMDALIKRNVLAIKNPQKNMKPRP